MALDLSYRSGSLVCAERVNLAVSLWFNTPSVEDVRAVVQQADRGRYAFDGSTMLLNVVMGRQPGRDAPRPDFSAEVRKELVAFGKRDDMHTVGTAHLVLAEGFLGATVRTFLNTIRLVARPKTPLQVFSDAASSAKWLAECSGPQPWDPRGIEMFFDEVLAAS